jgi:hypothetical protein
MEDEKSLRTQNLSEDTPSIQNSPYQMLIRQSRKLGVVATRAFTSLKTLLNQEVPLPPAADQFFDTLLHPSRAKNDPAREIVALRAKVKKSHEILVKAQTFTLFADEIIVDRSKVTIIKRHSFWASDVISIQIEDVLNVSASIGMIFGTLTIASRVMSTTDHYTVSMLWRNDVIDLKHIIQGYSIARHNDIDVGRLSKDALIESLRELGHDSGR